MTMGYGNYGSPGGGGRRVPGRLLIGLVIAAVGLFGYYSKRSVNPTTGEVQHVSLTPDQETALGLQSVPQMLQEMGGEVPPEHPAARLVRAVGAKVQQTSSAAKGPYRYQFHLIDDARTVNAFALPGGQVFVTAGLLTKLDDEAELAGVLGHEIGHVVERHSAQQMEKQKLGQSLVVATGVATSDRNNGGATVAMVTNGLIQKGFSRRDESEADECGLRFMTEAGYDPRAMIDVMKILQKEAGGGRQPQFLATHPDPGNRIQAIERWLTDHPAEAGKLTRGQKLNVRAG